MKKLQELQVKIFADGADLAGIREMKTKPWIRGFTTNPTLMRKAGVTDYAGFAQEVIAEVPDRPISFEVFADDFDEMRREALEIAKWGDNVYVKVPVTNTRSQSSVKLIRDLAGSGVKLNVTALLTVEQVREVAPAMAGGPGGFISVFAGRIADTGRDPIPIMSEALDVMRSSKNLELIWASPREILNIFHADGIGCHIITVTNDLLKKADLIGKDLVEYSLDTVKMFYEDGRKAGFKLFSGVAIGTS
jgi:transaldolase